MDITYLPMARGFVYLVAVLDWFSRKVSGLAAINDAGNWARHRSFERGDAPPRQA